MNTRIKELREYFGLSQRAFGEQIKTAGTHISCVERGINEPSDELINKICTAFGVKREWLLNGKGEMFSAYQPPYDEQHIGERVRTIRKEHGLSQRQFAEQIETTFDTVSRVELGKVIPARRWLQKVADKFGISLQWLLTGKETEENVVDAVLNRITTYLRANETARIATMEAINAGDDGIWIRIEQLVRERKK